MMKRMPRKKHVGPMIRKVAKEFAFVGMVTGEIWTRLTRNF